MPLPDPLASEMTDQPASEMPDQSASGTPPTVELPDQPAADAADAATSALADALASVGDRWTLLVIAALLDGPRRFGELQEDVHGIAPNVLSQRLRQLERSALVVARPYSERPPRFVYELSAAGRELAGALRLLAGWGARNAEGATAPRHAVCGTPMEARWWCPTCERPVSDDEGEELHFA
jgi:DNA-binding HxlR family transcriptional regulator